MANAGVPAGKKSEGRGVSASGGKVNKTDSESGNSMGIPARQTPGLGKGNKELSGNQLPSTARVVKPASSHLMAGMSQSRGSGGNK